jgi:hypothetical protein
MTLKGLFLTGGVDGTFEQLGNPRFSDIRQLADCLPLTGNLWFPDPIQGSRPVFNQQKKFAISFLAK